MPVREMEGKNWARATPILALYAMIRYSAARTSGRLSSSSEGRPAGSTGGEGSMPMALPRGMALLMMSRGERPSSTASAASA